MSGPALFGNLKVADIRIIIGADFIVVDLDLFRDIISQFSNYIMWEEVALKYSGIVVNPYFPEKGEAYLWYYGWNCAGGCVWDTNEVRLGKPQHSKSRRIKNH